MGGLSTGLAPAWLALRESVDAESRAAGLLDPLRKRLLDRSDTVLVIRDVGCGTGAMGRWLAGRLPGPQHWVLHDRDPELLARALGSAPGSARDGRQISVSAELADLVSLRAADLPGTSLVTASALLDLLTAEELDGLAEACLAAGCPALITLSVLGQVILDPPDPLDEEIRAAFNDHQRRFGRLGPDAFEAACAAFARGAVVHREPSPWHLGPGATTLAAEWLRGWVSAAVEQCPELAGEADGYLSRRLDANASGALRVVVMHADLLALPEAP